MKVKYCMVTLVVIIDVCFGARLENIYLPPGSAGSAGGAGLIPAPRPGSGGIGPGGRPGGGGGGAGGIGPGGRPGGGAGGFVGGYGGGDGGGGSGRRPQIGGGEVRPSVGGQASAGSGQEIPIVNFSSENNGDGNYAFSYETGNGITAQETGQSQGDTESVSGSYSYTGPDGIQYTITYTADADGFHPQGAHIPTPPPIPPEIQRGVELALAAEARGENQDGGSSSGQGGSSGSRGGQGGFGGGQGGGQSFGFGGAGASAGGGGGGSGGSTYQGPNSYQTSSHPGYQY